MSRTDPDPKRARASLGTNRNRECARSSGMRGGRGVYLAIGLGVGVLLGRIAGRSSHRTMPHLPTFTRALASTRGPVASALLAARIQARYETLYATRPRFAHPALRWHLASQILPGVALYQTLKEDAAARGADADTALAEAGAVIERLDMLARWLPLVRYAPGAFGLFRRITRLSLLLFPSAGWEIQMDEDSAQRVAFTIRRCFYLDVLKAYGVPELTAHYCHLDDVAYAALPPSIRWERSTTLGRGGTSCDFCWRAGSREAGPSRDTAQIKQETLRV